MEKKIKLSHILKPVYFIVFAIILEMVNFLWLGFTVTGNEAALQVLPKYFFIDIGVYLIVAGLIFLVSRKWSNVILYIFVGLQVLINIINATLYKVFGDIFSFDMMKLGEEAVSAFKFEFIDFWSIIVNLLILAAIIVLQVVLDRKLKKEYAFSNLRKTAIVLATFFSCLLVGTGAYAVQVACLKSSPESERVYASDKYLYNNMHFKLESYKKFGTWGFYIKSLGNLIYKNVDNSDETRARLDVALAEGQKDGNVAAELYGDNLIVIMMESFEWFAIDPFNTPTLWNIRTESGVSMENYYSKNKTNVSEDIALMGFMPKDLSMQSLAKEDKLSTGYTLPNLFSNRGYQTNFFHPFKKSFYDRDLINKAMGFDGVYTIEDAELENKSMSFNNWNLDSDFALSMMDKIIPSEGNFFSFFTTITTHGTYNRTNSRFTEYYERYDANLEQYKAWLSANTSYIYPESKTLEKCFRQYKCAAMDTDRLVKELIDNLEEKGLDRNTTILMYADHNCYYEDIYFNIKGTKKTDYYDIYNYNVPFMIYSKRLKPETRTDFVNTYDIYPTICSLFGLPYNTALTHGYDLFSDEIENSVMISYLSGAFNADFYSLNLVDVHYDASATQEELEKFRKNASLFYEKQFDIELMLKNGI